MVFFLINILDEGGKVIDQDLRRGSTIVPTLKKRMDSAIGSALAAAKERNENSHQAVVAQIIVI